MKKIEIASFNLESAIIAAKAGADRIELCENIMLGGTTPTAKLIIDTLNKVETTVYVMIGEEEEILRIPISSSRK